MYRCVIEGTPEGAGTDSGSSLYCISEMAARGQHQACSVARGAPFPCPGFTAMIAAPTTAPMAPAPPSAAQAPEPADDGAADPDQSAETTPPEQPAHEPRTVEELAGQTVKSSKEGIEKAGEAIGGTAKKAGEHISNAGSAIGNAASKTWNCLTSLFSSCNGDETAEPAAGEPSPGEPPPN